MFEATITASLSLELPIAILDTVMIRFAFEKCLSAAEFDGLMLRNLNATSFNACPLKFFQNWSKSPLLETA